MVSDSSPRERYNIGLTPGRVPLKILKLEFFTSKAKKKNSVFPVTGPKKIG